MSAVRAASAASPFDGEMLYRDVGAYDGLGEHRTATPGDDACSAWLRERLAGCGLAAELQPFASAVYEPKSCRIDVGAQTIAALPAWPVAQTPQGGLTARSCARDAGPLDGAIALVTLAYGGGGSWAAPRFADPVLDAIARKVRAVIAVTEGPTGGVIALNVAPERAAWPVPVVLAAGADGAALARTAAGNATVTLVSTGVTRAAAATNVVARRAGSGPTIVVSTPKSGWFHCAGERGSGIALFLALAEWLPRATARPLLFVATSGHELGEIGAKAMLRGVAPPAGEVALWLHLGADVAVQDIRFSGRVATASGVAVTERRLFVDAADADAATRAFAGCPGYDTPRILAEERVPGELRLFRDAGYARLAGLVGSGPLFHTRLDRTPLATTPAILSSVAVALRRFLQGFV